MEETLETKIVFCFGLFVFENGLIGFSNICKLCSSLRRGIVLGMIFDSQLSICVFGFLQSGIFVDLQNLEWIKLFLGSFLIVFLEEFFFNFILELILLEELFKESVCVVLFRFLELNSLDRSLDKSYSIGRSYHASEGEEGILDVKERSEEVSVHQVFNDLILNFKISSEYLYPVVYSRYFQKLVFIRFNFKNYATTLLPSSPSPPHYSPKK